MRNWRYDENLTKQYVESIGDWSPIDPIPVTFRIYVNNSGIKVYGLPNVSPTYAEYVLIKEGFLDDEGNMVFYSQQDLIDEVLKQLEEKGE